MDWQQWLTPAGEQPLDRLPPDGGLCGIFRTVGCIGDSLSSGEFESMMDGQVGYHDLFDYSWGQYLARLTGCTVYNYSRGGMTAQEYWQTFAAEQGFWDPAKACQAYIVALGVNDVSRIPLGQAEDSLETEGEPVTFAGYLGRILARYREIEPRAPFFLMTMVRRGDDAWFDGKVAEHAALLHGMAARWPNTWVIDLARFGPVYDADFRRQFYLGGHMNPAGYWLTSRLVAAYIDYIVRHDMPAFSQAGFIGTPWRREE